MRKFLPLLLTAALAVPPACASTFAGLRAVSGSSRQAASAKDVFNSKWSASAGFDRPAAVAGNLSVSPPLLHKPPGATLKDPAAHPILGTPGTRVREPKNPLERDGSPKKQKSGKGIWWGLGAAAAGAGLGFLVGGPAGAAIGAVLGALLGFFLGP